MSTNSNERVGKRHEFADVSVIVTTVALTVSLVIAATAVSIGIARADTLASIGESDGGRFMIAVLLAIVIAAMGGITAVMMPAGRTPRRQD